MSTAQTYRRDIGFGESLAWTPPAGTVEFYLWGKIGDDDSAIRWRRVTGWNIASNRPVAVPEAPHQFSVTLTGPEIALPWTELQGLFDGFDSEIAQVTAHGAGEVLMQRDVYHLPAPSSTDAATIAAQERRVLKKLLERRQEVIALGIVKLSSADGSGLEREGLGVFDRRIAEVRARIAWFEQAAAGDVLPRAEFW